MSLRAFTLIVLSAAASGCLGSALGDDGNGGNGGTGGGGNLDMAPDVVGQFYSEVAPIITPACAGCHGVTGTTAPAFMVAQPDLLQNILAVPGHHQLDAAEVAPLYEGAARGAGLHARSADRRSATGLRSSTASRGIGDGGDVKPTHLAVRAVDVGDEHDRSGGARRDAARRQGDLQRRRWSAPRSS